MGLVLLAFGLFSLYFGGKYFDKFNIALGSIVAFFIVAMICSAIGGFKVLEGSAHVTAGRVVATLFSFLVSFAAAAAAGWIIYKTDRIRMMVLGGISGFFLSGLVFALFIAPWASSSTFLWILMVVMIGLGAFLGYKYEQRIAVILCVFVGAYAVVRGISYFAGGFPSEVEMISLMSSGAFEYPWTFYAYLAGFLGLAITGLTFQHKNGYHLQQEEKENRYQSA